MKTEAERDRTTAPFSSDKTLLTSSVAMAFFTTRCHNKVGACPTLSKGITDTWQGSMCDPLLLNGKKGFPSWGFFLQEKRSHCGLEEIKNAWSQLQDWICHSARHAARDFPKVCWLGSKRLHVQKIKKHRKRNECQETRDVFWAGTCRFWTEKHPDILPSVICVPPIMLSALLPLSFHRLPYAWVSISLTR